MPSHFALPDPPDTTPPERPPRRHCPDCDGELEPGQQLRCRLCVEAAHAAIRANPGQVIRPSDVARHRAPD